MTDATNSTARSATEARFRCRGRSSVAGLRPQGIKSVRQMSDREG